MQRGINYGKIEMLITLHTRMSKGNICIVRCLTNVKCLPQRISLN